MYGLDERLPAMEDLLLDTLLNPSYRDLDHLDTLVKMVRTARRFPALCALRPAP